MRLLVIGYVWPEPASSAAGSRMLGLMDGFLRQGWEVVFATPAVATGHQADLEGRGIACQAITLNCSTFDEFVAELQPDIVLFDRFMMEEQFGWRVEKACPDALRVLDTEDLHSLRLARRQRLRQVLRESREPDAQDAAVAELMQVERGEWFRWMAPLDLAQREIAALYRCDLTLVISDFEQALLTEQFGVPPELIHYCPFQLDLPVGDGLPFSGREHFLSIGNFRHEPNWDAVLWLKQRVWPLIRKQLPGAELHLYGAYPPPKATALHNAREGFLVKGWADDALGVMGAARVCLAPLRFGAGLKGKLADAMQASTPSVTTPLGAEGMMGREGGWAGQIAARPEELARAAMQLYTDPQRWQAARERGRRIIRERFARGEHERALVERIRAVRYTLAEHRHRNFTGAMLRHHQHQSTRYMSHWIEAKTRLRAANSSGGTGATYDAHEV